MNVPALFKPVKDRLVPDREAPRKVWRGPARGLRYELNPRDELWIQLGLLEPEIQEAVGDLGHQSACCYDIGAAWGYYTCLLARASPGGIVHAFEPDRERLDQLESNVALNSKTSAPVRVHEAQVGRVHDPETGRVTLDGLVEEGLRPPDAIKMDIQGDEAAALEGARRLLQKTRPVLVIEVHSDDLRRRCGRRLRDVGYDVERIPVNTTWYRDPDRPNPGRCWLVARPEHPVQETVSSPEPVAAGPALESDDATSDSEARAPRM